MKVNLRI